MPLAIEEFLRAFAPVTMAREVKRQTQINGCTFQEGANGAALSLPGRQSRSGYVSRRRQGHHRSQAKTATPPSASASIAASAPTWRAWR